MLTVILTGGASRRMGQDKAMLPMKGKSMALYLAQKYEILGPVAFSVNRKGRFPVGKYLELPDSYPNCGPLNGLVSAFRQTDTDVVFLTATDMPGADPVLVKKLLESLKGYDACMYGNEPLFAVYRRCCLDMAVSCLESGSYSFQLFLTKIHVRHIPADDKDAVLNLNTPEEYRDYIQKI